MALPSPGNPIAADEIYEEWYKTSPIAGTDTDIADLGNKYGISTPGNEIEFADFHDYSVYKMEWDYWIDPSSGLQRPMNPGSSGTSKVNAGSAAEIIFKPEIIGSGGHPWDFTVAWDTVGIINTSGGHAQLNIQYSKSSPPVWYNLIYSPYTAVSLPSGFTTKYVRLNNSTEINNLQFKLITDVGVWEVDQDNAVVISFAMHDASGADTLLSNIPSNNYRYTFQFLIGSGAGKADGINCSVSNTSLT